MIDKQVPGDYDTRYYPLVDMDDTGKMKATLFPALSAAQLKGSKKPYLEEIVPHVFHLRGKQIKAEIACPRCGKQMEHYIDYNKQAVYLCIHCL